MHSNYVKAIETKTDWLEYLNDGKMVEAPEVNVLYKMSLNSDNTFFMNSKFAELVDHARKSIPDDLEWDNSWVQTATGFLWIEGTAVLPKFVIDFTDPMFKKVLKEELKPYPELEKFAKEEDLDKYREMDIKLPAVGWVPMEKVRLLPDGRTYAETTGSQHSITDATAFLCFLPNTEAGFTPWAYFTIKTGDKLIDRIKSFEQNAEKAGGQYPSTRITEMLHEIRWIYAAFHLMSQRLAITIDKDTDRATIRRAERDKKKVIRKFRVVSLRRLEEARKKASKGEGEPIDWQFQWTVQGHWRNQWCPATKSHKQIFIEAFIKGPDDKPFKDPSKRIFTAVR